MIVFIMTQLGEVRKKIEHLKVKVDDVDQKHVQMMLIILSSPNPDDSELKISLCDITVAISCLCLANFLMLRFILILYFPCNLQKIIKSCQSLISMTQKQYLHS